MADLIVEKNYLVFDADDMGATHVISDTCQSHDCRDILGELKEFNPNFKATLFTIPGEATLEMLQWAFMNKDWIELAWHGFYHHSNYECEKMSYKEFDSKMKGFMELFGLFFVKGFKAPGWQISEPIYYWLRDNGFWVADQPGNKARRPDGLRVYEVGENSVHTHTWNCVGNGVYELRDELIKKVTKNKDWKFVSEVVS